MASTATASNAEIARRRPSQAGKSIEAEKLNATAKRLCVTASIVNAWPGGTSAERTATALPARINDW